MSAKEEIVDWLRDAYAMERGMEVVMKKTSTRSSYSNLVHFATGKHLEETKRHADRVATLLQSLGSDTSTIKTGAGIMANAVASLGTMMAGDELIKDLLVSYAMEHFEIACYRTLIIAARKADLSHVAEVCQQILSNEEQVAATIMQAMPQIVDHYFGELQRAKAA